jgi:hypothetical protein
MKLLVHFINLLLWYHVPLAITFILSFSFDFSYYAVVKSPLFGAIYTIGSFVFTIFYMASVTERSPGDDVSFLQFIKTDNK